MLTGGWFGEVQMHVAPKEQRNLILLLPLHFCPAENQWGVSSQWVTSGDAGRGRTLRNLYLINFASFLPFGHPKILLSRKQLPWKWVIAANPSVSSFWAVVYGTDNLQHLLFKTVTVFIGLFCLGQYYDDLPGRTVNKSDVYHDESNIVTFKKFVFWMHLLSLLETYCSCQHIS